MAGLTGAEWERLEALERNWDTRLGGAETRPYRDMACYCAGKMLAAGASFDDVAEYLRAAHVEFVRLLKPPAGAS